MARLSSNGVGEQTALCSTSGQAAASTSSGKIPPTDSLRSSGTAHRVVKSNNGIDRRMKKFRPLSALAVCLLATLISACGSESEPTKAAISINSEAPLVVKSSDPTYGGENGGTWFTHDLTIENSSDRAIVIDYSGRGEYLDNYRLLVADSNCGYSAPDGGDRHARVGCTAAAFVPRTVAPHESAKLVGIGVDKDRPGMKKARIGTYVWNKQISWHFIDSSETQRSSFAITYTLS
jgi:hypothetical protein